LFVRAENRLLRARLLEQGTTRIGDSGGLQGGANRFSRQVDVYLLAQGVGDAVERLDRGLGQLAVLQLEEVALADARATGKLIKGDRCRSALGSPNTPMSSSCSSKNRRARAMIPSSSSASILRAKSSRFLVRSGDIRIAPSWSAPWRPCDWNSGWSSLFPADG
jgi:hypothetical protein